MTQKNNLVDKINCPHELTKRCLMIGHELSCTECADSKVMVTMGFAKEYAKTLEELATQNAIEKIEMICEEFNKEENNINRNCYEPENCSCVYQFVEELKKSLGELKTKEDSP